MSENNGEFSLIVHEGGKSETQLIAVVRGAVKFAEADTGASHWIESYWLEFYWAVTQEDAIAQAQERNSEATVFCAMPVPERIAT